ncbi:hypothetical protein B0H13DRAFT_1916365 [Mycena leptocephala]|nr:hypothetical protein B0H13DRAFT_1916365 [Mycena leptocephala]
MQNSTLEVVTQSTRQADLEWRAGKAALETSFAALGLLGHKPRSIFRYYEYVGLDVGFHDPSRIHKHISAKNGQHNFTVQAGIAGVGHGVTALSTYNYNRGSTETVQADDTKPLPKLKVTPHKEAPEEKNTTSFGSYSFDYGPRADPMNGVRSAISSLSVGLGMGTDLYTDRQALPSISCINQHQINVWVLDEQCTIQGIIISFSTIVADIQRNSKIQLDASLGVDAYSGEVTGGGIHRWDGPPKAFFLGGVSLPRAGQKPPSLPQLLWGTGSNLTGVQLPLDIVVADIGWDNTNKQWRSPIHMRLDKHLQPTRDRVVAYEIYPFQP